MTNTPLKRLSLAVIFGLSSANAATMANFNFTDGSLSNAASPISGITVSPLASASNFLSFTSNTGWNSAAQISGAAGFFSSPSTQTAAQNAVHFTITATSGYHFSLDGFSFLARSTASAPADIGFKINASLYDFGDSYSNNETITSISSSSLDLTNLTSATISIQGWNASGSASLQLDNIILTGSVIPETSTLILFMSGALLLLRRRR